MAPSIDPARTATLLIDLQNDIIGGTPLMPTVATMANRDEVLQTLQ